MIKIREKTKVHKALEADYHRKRMDAAAFKVLFPIEEDFLMIEDNSVFSERNPPYDQENNELPRV